MFIPRWWAKSYWMRLDVKGESREEDQSAFEWFWKFACESSISELNTVVIGMWVL